MTKLKISFWPGRRFTSESIGSLAKLKNLKRINCSFQYTRGDILSLLKEERYERVDFNIFVIDDELLEELIKLKKIQSISALTYGKAVKSDDELRELSLNNTQISDKSWGSGLVAR